MAPSRLLPAMAASVLAHTAGLAALGQLQPGWPSAEGSAERARAEPFRVAMRAQAASRQEHSAPAGDETKRGMDSAKQRGMIPPHAYYPAHLLDEHPQIRVHVEPAFPAGATAASGRVALRIYVGEHGEVEAIEVIDADPPGQFELAAAQAFARARFTPGRIRGKAVKNLMLIEVLFGDPLPLHENRAGAGSPRSLRREIP